MYTGRCSKICFELKAKYDLLHTELKTAVWQNRAEHNDFLWAECSNCGFTIENYKAVKSTKSSTVYDEVIYKYCPMCGRRMGV
jgi:predicted nucleic-acid-binding Zn-ribbon protein